MTTILKTAAAGIAALMMFGALAPIGTAQARDRDGAIVAGAVGGLALGAVLGSALAAPPPPVDYGPPPRPRRVYVRPDDEDCGSHRVRIYDEDGEFVGYKRVPNC